MNIPDHISESLESIFGLKIFKFFDADPDPESGIEKFGSGIRDKHPGSATLYKPLEMFVLEDFSETTNVQNALDFYTRTLLRYHTCTFNKFYVYFEHNYCFINSNVKTYF